MAGNIVSQFINIISDADSGDTLKFDSDSAVAMSKKLSSVSSEIDLAASRIEGMISENKSVWTGKAAEAYFSELTTLVSQAKEIAEKVNRNRQNIDRAAMILAEADKKAEGDVGKLDAKDIFNYS